MITVKDLRDALCSYDDEAIVFLSDNEDDFIPLKEITYIKNYQEKDGEFLNYESEIVLRW